MQRQLSPFEERQRERYTEPDPTRWTRPVHPTERKFDSNQPRDEQGRWTDSQGRGVIGGDAGDSSAGSDDSSIVVAGRGNEAECDLQYRNDSILCNMVRLPSCWAQAAERYGACLSGRRIPQLRF